MTNSASPWTRLGAYFIDVLVFMVAYVFFLVGTLVGDAGTVLIVVGVLLSLALIVVYFWLLATRGQTFGKMALNVRIVRQADGENGGLVTNVLMRSIVGQGLLAIVPFYSLVDILFIFREDRRCIHDLIAGTVVVQA